MFHALAATGLLACGASALNQLLERKQDARMRRTASRPLPAGRLPAELVGVLGSGLCVAGLAYLAVAVNALTCLLGALTVVMYLLVYTPLKRVTWLNTMVGAIPGALPPLMGWTAAQNELAMGGVLLFAIQFCWQIPHFMAIAWIYREDYARGGFQMLPLVDAGGRRTGRLAVVFALGVAGVSVVPAWFGLAGMVYLGGALALGILYAGAAAVFAQHRSLANARRLFVASIFYLPLLIGLLALDQVKRL
jgi:protoheme IX farnesyltransferase